MRQLILAVFLIAAVSASSSFLEPKNAFYLARLAAKHANIQVNATAFWLGANSQLNIVSNQDVLRCGGDFIPTLEGLQDVMGAIENFAFGIAFDDIDPLIAQLQKFKSECQPVYNTFGAYFGDAIRAYKSDQAAFARTVERNLVNSKVDSLVKAAEVILSIVDNDSTTAGRIFATLAQSALAGYLPN